MRRDGRLSAVLHVLLHLVVQPDPQTSESLARALETNPVVVRRMMAGLRERGFVRSEKGHGGGWTLSCDLAQTTLRDIYNALGRPEILAIGHRAEAPGCLVEQAVNAALEGAFHDAETLLLHRFDEITLAQLSADLRNRLAARGSNFTVAAAHGG